MSATTGKQYFERCQVLTCIHPRDEQYALGHTLRLLRQRPAEAETRPSNDLKMLKQDIVESISSTALDSTKGLVRKLLEAQRNGAVLLPQADILASLNYADIQKRWDYIEIAGADTYNWILDKAGTASPELRYIQWLEEDKGIFWITGKAGSGKSTLMKYISDHERTREALKKWANGRKWLGASHYFWFPGTEMQKSYEGLLRSLLFDVLKQCPSIIEVVCSARWRDAVSGHDPRENQWTLTELRACLLVLAQTQLQFEGHDLCFSFFVDGLDEYDGGHEEMVRMFQTLTAGDRVKMCVSSRPWEVFQESLEDSKKSGNSIELHLYTQSDIAKVVNYELGPRLAKRAAENRSLEDLTSEIINRSQGVFLWVTLVIRKEMIPGLRNRESVDFLRKRLREIPEGMAPCYILSTLSNVYLELDDYFEAIFARAWKDKKYRKDTANIFRTCIAAPEPLPIATFEVLVHENPTDYAISASIDPNYPWHHPQFVDDIRARINGRCQDLLAVEQQPTVQVTGESDTEGVVQLCRIDFLHRTVRDFLRESESVSKNLDKYARVDCSAAMTLAACYTFLVKKAPGLDPFSKGSAKYLAAQWSTEALRQLTQEVDCVKVSALVEALDVSMQVVSKAGTKLHWSNTILPGQHANSAEHGQRDFLGHLIQFGPESEVQARFRARSCITEEKKGRPYLDYALRQHGVRTGPGNTTKHHPGVGMVDMLLSLGCDVNEKVHIYGGRTVWDLYLAHIYELGPVLRDGEYQTDITWSLIRNGAQRVEKCTVEQTQPELTAKYGDIVPRKRVLSMEQILAHVFEDHVAKDMTAAVAKISNSPGGWMSALPYVGKFW